MALDEVIRTSEPPTSSATAGPTTPGTGPPVREPEPLTHEGREQLRAQVRAVMEEHELGMREAGPEAYVSASALQRWLASTLGDDAVAVVDTKMQRWLQMRATQWNSGHELVLVLAPAVALPLPRFDERRKLVAEKGRACDNLFRILFSSFPQECHVA
jgi:hypothetical protein